MTDRRQAGTGLLRRPGARGSAGAGIDRTVEAILGSKLTEWWDTRYGYALDTDGTVLWITGQKQGVTLTPSASSNQPQWVLSDSQLGNLPAILGNSASNECVGATGISPVLFSGSSNAYMFCVGYQGGTPGAGKYVFTLEGTGVNIRTYENNQQMQIVDSAAAGHNFNLDPNPTDGLSHFVEGWYDTSGPEAGASQDGADATPDAGDTGIRDDCSSVGIGGNIAGGGNGSDWVWCAFGICNAMPSAAERAALLAYYQGLRATQ